MPPLSGRTIALLRAKGQGGDLRSGLEALGATIIEVPMIAIAPPEDPSPLLEAARAVSSFDWVALTSPNAVAAFVDAVEETLGERARDALERVSIASVGPGTSRALAAAKLTAALEATESLQEGLARALAVRGLQGKRVLLPHADQARDALEMSLREAGAHVTSVIAYRTVEGEGDASALISMMDSGKLDAVCFTSASTAKHLARRIGEPSMRQRFAGPRPIAASLGPVASKALRELGVEPGVEARVHTAAGLVDALREALEGA